MKSVTITVTMHTASRVATGSARFGLDAVLDERRIPASSLKGLMRAAAREILGLDDSALTGIFGSVGAAANWAWNDLDLPDGPAKAVTTRVRIPIDHDSGTAAEGGLFHAQELWLDEEASFMIDQTAPTGNADDEALVLAAAAMAVKGLGASRRRGLGWTTWRARIGGRDVDVGRAVAAVERLRGQRP